MSLLVTALRQSNILNTGNGLFTVAPGSSAQQTFSISGASLGDPVALGISGALKGLIFGAAVESTGVVTVHAYNPTNAAVTLDPYTSAVVLVLQPVSV